MEHVRRADEGMRAILCQEHAVPNGQHDMLRGCVGSEGAKLVIGPPDPMAIRPAAGLAAVFAEA
eukprot:997281-Alexandrium_andersonii.AAC.1